MKGSPLERALEALQEQLPSGPVEERIVRVEARDEGLILTVTGNVQERYFRWTGELCEIAPRDDDALRIWRTSFADRDPEILTWRPGRRLVASFVSFGGEPVILKAYKKRRMPGAFANQQRLSAATRDPQAFVVARPLNSDDASAAYTMERLQGEELRIEAASAAAFESVGRALLQMQESVEVADLPEHTPEQELERMRALAGRVQAAAGSLPPGWAESLQHAARNACTSGRTVAVHGDLHDGNLMRIGARVGLLDFDMLCAGDAALDLANLTAHLTLRAMQGIRGASDAHAATCESALLRGFDRTGTEFERALEFYRATTFLRLALVYHLRPRWASLTPALVQLAETCIHEVTLLR